MTILQVLADAKLLAQALVDPDSWEAWRAFLAATFGRPPLTAAQEAIFARATSRSTPPAQAVREAWCIVARRGGKSRVASMASVYLACFRDYRRSSTRFPFTSGRGANGTRREPLGSCMPRASRG